MSRSDAVKEVAFLVWLDPACSDVLAVEAQHMSPVLRGQLAQEDILAHEVLARDRKAAVLKVFPQETLDALARQQTLSGQARQRRLH